MSVRAIPEIPRGETGIRGKARKLARRFGKSRYCFTAPIDEIEKLLVADGDGKEGAKDDPRRPPLHRSGRERSGRGK